MGRTIHGKRTKGSTAKLTHNCCIFGIMGGTAPLTGVPLAHRAYLQKRAARKALCIQDCAKGHKYLKDHGILGCNPQAGGVGNMWRHRHYSHRWGTKPEGDGSAHGSRGKMSELLGSGSLSVTQYIPCLKFGTLVNNKDYNVVLTYCDQNTCADDGSDVKPTVVRGYYNQSTPSSPTNKNSLSLTYTGDTLDTLKNRMDRERNASDS